MIASIPYFISILPSTIYIYYIYIYVYPYHCYIVGIHQDRSPKTEAAGRPRLGRYTVPEEVAQCQQVGTMTPRHQVLGGQGHTMFLAPVG